MDIAKYIALYLVKNKFCYIHGLGNFQIIKRSAGFEGDKVTAPSYEVQLSQMGSVDDSFANFIANNEQVSIAAAANAIREFSTQAKADLAAGKEVEIPALGKIINAGSGYRFITDAKFSYQPIGIPIVPVREKVEEQKQALTDYSEPSESNVSVNWSKIIVLALVALVVLAAVGYGIYALTNTTNETVATPQAEDTVIAVPETVPPVIDSNTVLADTTAVDSNNVAAVAAVSDSGTIVKYKVVVGNYSELAKAEKRLKTLQGTGSNVQLQTIDSGNFRIIMEVNTRHADSAKAVDSIRRFYSPSGVSVLK